MLVKQGVVSRHHPSQTTLVISFISTNPNIWVWSHISTPKLGSSAPTSSLDSGATTRQVQLLLSVGNSIICMCTAKVEMRVGSLMGSQWVHYKFTWRFQQNDSIQGVYEFLFLAMNECFRFSVHSVSVGVWKLRDCVTICINIALVYKVLSYCSKLNVYIVFQIAKWQPLIFSQRFFFYKTNRWMHSISDTHIICKFANL